MIPRLYDKNATAWTTNGIGGLGEATYCHVTEKRNGSYELKMQYPITGKHYADLEEENIIVSVPAMNATEQPFRIYKISKPMNGIVTVYAEHISYQLSFIPVEPFTASSCANAIASIPSHVMEDCPFTFWTDKSVDGNLNMTTPKSVRELLGGEYGSILDTYGTGEYEWDNYTVRLYLNRGANRGVSIRYGKNLVGLTQEIDYANIVTGIYPYYEFEDVVVMLPERVLESPYAISTTYPRTITLNMTEYFEETPTEDQLRSEALGYLKRNADENPKISLDVNFVLLSKSPEYAGYALLEQVNLCDTVHVYHEQLGVDASMKVSETEYDVLRDRYERIKLGSTRTTLVKRLSDVHQSAVTNLGAAISQIDQSVQTVTDTIMGVNGGYVVQRLDANGKPYEILIMDSDDINVAVNVLRLNRNGIGFSHTGYGGPYTSAWTIDGHFVADFIDTGNLNASIIRSGAISSADGRSFVLDIDGNAIHVGEYDEFMNLYNAHFSFSGGALTISNDSSAFAVRISNERLSFLQAGTEIAYMTGHYLYIKDVRVLGNLEQQVPGSDSYVQQYVDTHGRLCAKIIEVI